MSPINIEFLFHSHYSPAVFPRPSPGAAESAAKLLAMNLIQKETITTSGEVYSTTERGRVFVKMLCDLEPPARKTVWSDANGNQVTA